MSENKHRVNTATDSNRPSSSAEVPTPSASGDVAEDADLYRLIGERVQIHRQRVGLSQAALADRVGVTRTSITNLELGKQRLPLAGLLRIAVALELHDYRDLLPTPQELAMQGSEPPLDAPASGHPFWAYVGRLLWAMYRSPTQRLVRMGETPDLVEILVQDENPLQLSRTLFAVFPRKRPVSAAAVANVRNRIIELSADRGVIITSSGLTFDAVAVAGLTHITVITPAELGELHRKLSETQHARASQGDAFSPSSSLTPPTRSAVESAADPPPVAAKVAITRRATARTRRL